jgi:hypothetical protein
VALARHGFVKKRIVDMWSVAVIFKTAETVSDAILTSTNSRWIV